MAQQGDTRSVHRTHLLIERDLYDALREYVNRQNANIAAPARWTITGVIQAAVSEYLDRHDSAASEQVA